MFKENSFLLSIALILLLAGVIVYYVNGRFKNIENSLQKQNTILSDFITNVRNDLGSDIGDIVTSNNTTKEIFISGPPSPDATLEAKISAENYLTKIDVSDNESDTDTDSDSDSDSDSESIDDTQININKEQNIEDVKVIDISKDTSDDETLVLPELEPIDTINKPRKIIESSDLTNLSSDLKAVKLEKSISADDVSDDVELLLDNIVDNVVGQSLDDSVGQSTESLVSEVTDTDLLSNIPYKKMKVDDLKKIALDNNLSTPAEIHKLRKVELVSLLENNQDKINQ